MTEALPCIVCDKTFTNVEFSNVNQPYDGTAFQTNGHYGSTFWDDLRQKIEINVCDDCLKLKRATHVTKLPIIKRRLRG